MAKKPKKSLADETIVLPPNVHPFLLVLLALSGGVAVSTGLVLGTIELPPYALPVLAITIVMAGLIFTTGVKYLQPTRINLGPSALHVVGPEGDQEFNWGQIDTVQVVGGTGCLADNPFKPSEKRIGLAVFLKGGPEGRNEVSQADAILASGELHQGERFIDIAARISKAHKSRGKPQVRGKSVKRIGSGGRSPRAKAA